MTAKEYREKANNKKPRKYRNTKIKHNGLTFDSKKEFHRYLVLKDLVAKKEICNLQTHPKFVLQEGYRAKNGQKVRAITYSADFSYTRMSDNAYVVEDVKSNMTKKLQHYKDKIKILMYRYPNIEFKEVV